METNRIKTLLHLTDTNEFCVKGESGDYHQIEENAEGQIKSVMSCLGYEIFGHWPLEEEEQRLFRNLTTLKFQPDKRITKNRQSSGSKNHASGSKKIQNNSDPKAAKTIEKTP